MHDLPAKRGLEVADAVMDENPEHCLSGGRKPHAPCSRVVRMALVLAGFEEMVAKLIKSFEALSKIQPKVWMMS